MEQMLILFFLAQLIPIATKTNPMIPRTGSVSPNVKYLVALITIRTKPAKVMTVPLVLLFAFIPSLWMGSMSSCNHNCRISGHSRFVFELRVLRYNQIRRVCPHRFIAPVLLLT